MQMRLWTTFLNPFALSALVQLFSVGRRTVGSKRIAVAAKVNVTQSNLIMNGINKTQHLIGRNLKFSSTESKVF